MEASTSAGTSKSITSGSCSFTSDMFPGSDLLSSSRCSGAIYLLHNSSGVASGCFSCGEVGEASLVCCVLCLDQQFFGFASGGAACGWELAFGAGTACGAGCGSVFPDFGVG